MGFVLPETRCLEFLRVSLYGSFCTMRIDEIVFAALFPKKVQTAIYELEPIRVQYTRLFGQAESCAVFTLMCAAVIVPYFVWVLPISEMMFAVKVEYCGGNQDFVVSFNQDVSNLKE